VAELHPEARKLIESDRLAHMVTLNPDGSPQVTCIWVGMDGDEIVSGHLPRNQKVKNVERDGRVAISIEGEQLSEMGLKEYLVVRGTARIQRGGAAELL
jgi:PPOX class probable F420-dependent enzyme